MVIFTIPGIYCDSDTYSGNSGKLFRSDMLRVHPLFLPISDFSDL